MARITQTRATSYKYRIEDAQKAFFKERVIEIGFIDGIKYFDCKTKQEIKGEHKWAVV